jgi:Glycosyl transferase family 2
MTAPRRRWSSRSEPSSSWIGTTIEKLDTALSVHSAPVNVLKVLFWGSAGALAWTHAGYPLAAALAARLRPRPVRRQDETPSVTIVVAAHDEEAVIERRLQNLLALDYPPDRAQIVVASDASEDATDQIVERIAALEPRVHLLRCPRGGKVVAQDLAVRESDAEIVAFSDANATWAPDALARLVRSFADPDVAYACGRLVLETPEGTNREGAYWRFETWLREQESALGSITGGNGAIYALRRTDYPEVDSRFGHDLSLPYLLVQRGRRAVYDPEALAFEKPTPDIEDEFRRKVRMFEHCWAIVGEGKMLRDLPPGYLAQILSHRHLRYGSGLLHLVLLGATAALVREGRIYQAALAAQASFLALAGARPGIARYYTLVTWATVVSLFNYLREGVPTVWEKAEGTR